MLSVIAARGRLGLSGIDPAIAMLFCDKELMKAAVPPTLMPTPEGCPATDDDAVRRLFAASGRVVIKPRLESGSRGVEGLSSAAAVEAVLARPAAQRAHALVERYIDGALLHLDAVVRSGRLLFSSLGHYETPPLTFSAGPG